MNVECETFFHMRASNVRERASALKIVMHARSKVVNFEPIVSIVIVVHSYSGSQRPHFSRPKTNCSLVFLAERIQTNTTKRTHRREHIEQNTSKRMLDECPTNARPMPTNARLQPHIRRMFAFLRSTGFALNRNDRGARRAIVYNNIELVHPTRLR